MSQPPDESRWMTCQPRILATTPEMAPTKPSEPGSVGFVGAIQEEYDEIRADDSYLDVIQTMEELLRNAGVVFMDLEGIATIGFWNDLDSPDIREALRVLGKDCERILYLDTAQGA